jgi:hypothetical protein
MTDILETLWLKHTLTADENLALAQSMARAEAVINEKADELKSVSTTIKAEIATQEGILHSCAEKLRSGYEMRQRQCRVTYDKGIIKYVDKDTGEILEERPMTQDEQLRLTGNRVDAETIIRQASEEDE